MSAGEAPAPVPGTSPGSRGGTRPVLRPLRPDDAEAAAGLVRAAFAAQAVATDPPSSALRETADSLRAWMAADGGVVAEEAGAPIALLLWAERAGGLYCGRLAVVPPARAGGSPVP